MPMDEKKISVVINTYNAEKYLSRVLDSVKGFDEILVCDMESNDDTLNIANSYGCRIITFPKGNYQIVEPARDYAIHQARYPWVLVIDADELITAELRDYLYKYIGQENPAAGLKIPRRNRLMGQFMHGSYPDHILRFFRKDLTEWPPIIHIQPKVKGSVKYLPSSHSELAFNHLDDKSIKDRVDVINRYSDYEIPKRANKRYGYFAFFHRPLFRFFKSYILKRGFMDGIPGLIWAGLEAVSQFIILAKLYEHKRNS